jgi:hypothetical protein
MGLIRSIGLGDIISAHLSYDQSEKFKRWAFGEDVEDFESIVEFARAWNEKHGSLLKINLSSTIKDDIELMIDLWLDSQNPC